VQLLASLEVAVEARLEASGSISSRTNPGVATVTAVIPSKVGARQALEGRVVQYGL
jgi:hypothetical protein